MMIKQPRAIFYAVGLGAILLCSFLLRINGLTKYPFWLDEIYTEGYTPSMLDPVGATVGMGTAKLLLSNFFQDYTPPLYYGLVWVYGHFFSGEMALRMLSVVMGMAALFVFYRVALFFLGRQGALAAVAIMGVSPFFIWYAQEARAYTTISFISLLTVYCFLMAIRNNRWSWWLGFLTAGALAIWASYYCAILLLFLAGLFFKARCVPAFRGILFFISILGLSLFLVPGLSQQMDSIIHGQFWLPSPCWRSFFFTPLVFTAGYLAQPYLMVPGLVFCWGLWIRGLTTFFREDQDKFSLIFSCSFLPLWLIFCISRIGFSIYIDRQLIIFSPFVLICMVRAILSFRNVLLKAGIVLLGTLFMMLSVLSYDQGKIFCYNDLRGDFYQGVHPRKDYRVLLGHFLDKLQPGDKIVTADIQSFWIVTRTLRNAGSAPEKNIFIFVPGKLTSFESRIVASFDKLKKMSLLCGPQDVCGFVLINNVRTLKKIDPDDLNQGRAWFVSSSWDHNPVVSANVSCVGKMLAGQSRETVSLAHDGFFVRLYEK